MDNRRHLSDAERNQVVGMLQNGASQGRVAERFAVSQSVISRLWMRFQERGEVAERPRSGRPRSTTARQDRYISIIARRNRFHDASSLNRQFAAATGTRISSQTLRRRLHDNNLWSCRPALRIPLSVRHRQARLVWCQDHDHWRRRDWQCVLFTDESRFCLDYHDGRRRVWRQSGERYVDCTVVEHDRYGGGSVMVWGGICYDGHTDLYVIRDGSLTAQRYRDEILHPIVRPFAGAMGPDFVLMDDNARPHRARIVQEYLQQETIERLEWPAMSPDLNPIEHLWDYLQTCISRRPQAPTTLTELGTALAEEWDNIPQMRIQRLIDSMQRRLRAVLAAAGGHTTY